MLCRRATAVISVKQTRYLSNIDMLVKMIKASRTFTGASAFCVWNCPRHITSFPNFNFNDKLNLSRTNIDYIPISKIRKKNSVPILPCKREKLHESTTFDPSSASYLSLYQSIHKVSYSTLRNVQGTSLLHACDTHRKSQQRMKTSSPAQLILESSPSSLQPYLRLIRFDKPIGTWLLYWPCTWSIALAAPPGCLPDVKLLTLFGVGAFFMRGAGCIINDMWDKDFDKKVARTKQRPLASGELTTFQALVMLGFQLSVSLSILLQLNWYSVFLGASSMGLVILYPLAKRYTYWPQLMLGFTFNYGALLGWSAVQGSTDWAVCLPLYFSCIFWTLVYDTIYAHQDKYDDMLIGVKSSALRLGDQTKPWLYGFTALMTGGLTAAGLMCHMTWPYYTAVALTSGRLAQQTYSVQLDNADDCANAFRGNFYLGVVMFGGIVLANMLKSKKQQNDEKNNEGDIS